MKKQSTLIAIMVVLVLLAGGGGFYGGMTYQKAQTPTFAGGFGSGNFTGGAGGTQGGQNGQRGQGGTMRFFDGQGGRPVNGEVISKDDNSITVKMQDGSTKIVMLSKTTTISKFAKGATADLKKGERVMALGQQNSDGSITATMVQVGGPQFQRVGQPSGQNNETQGGNNSQ